MAQVQVDARAGLLVAATFEGNTIQKSAVLKGVGTVEVDPADQVGAGFFNHDITITGVAVGDLIFMQPPHTLEDELKIVGLAVQAANTVRVRMESTGAINGAAIDWAYQIYSKS